MVNSWTRRVSIQTVPGDGIWQMHIQVRRFAYEILRVWWLVAGSRMCVQRSRFSKSSYPSRTDSLGKMKEVCPASKPTVLLKVRPGQSFSDVGGSSYETNGRWTNGTSVYFVGSIPCQLPVTKYALRMTPSKRRLKYTQPSNNQDNLSAVTFAAQTEA